MPQRFTKDPQAVLDYYVDWSAVLGGDEIISSTWATADTIILGADAIFGMFTQIWVAGGDVNTMAAVTNHIITAGGREDERTIYLELHDQ